MTPVSEKWVYKIEIMVDFKTSDIWIVQDIFLPPQHKNLLLPTFLKSYI